jgi:hypothetical protein
MNLLIVTLLIILEAGHEGLADRGSKLLGGVIEAFYLLFVTFIIIMWSTGGSWTGNTVGFVNMGIGYLLLRYALFDIVYNATRGVNIFFIGTTKLYDRLWKRFLDWTRFPDIHFLLWTKLLCLLIGLSLLLNWA